MKQLIQQTAEASGSAYELWAELTTCSVPNTRAALKFSTVWTGAANATGTHTQAEFFLTAQALAQLKTLLNTRL